MILVADNDYLHKLAVCDLLPELLDLWEISHQDVLVNSSAKFKFRNLYKKNLGDESYKRLAGFLCQCNQLSSVNNNSDIDSLASIPDIDQGEALLLSAAANLEDFIFATGDKRCIAAVAKAGNLDSLRSRIKGRVECLEQTILKLIDKNGCEHVVNKIIPSYGHDAALRTIFSSTSLDEQSIRDGLNSYVSHLARTDLLNK